MHQETAILKCQIAVTHIWGVVDLVDMSYRLRTPNLSIDSASFGVLVSSNTRDGNNKNSIKIAALVCAASAYP